MCHRKVLALSELLFDSPCTVFLDPWMHGFIPLNAARWGILVKNSVYVLHKFVSYSSNLFTVRFTSLLFITNFFFVFIYYLFRLIVLNWRLFANFLLGIFWRISKFSFIHNHVKLAGISTHKLLNWIAFPFFYNRSKNAIKVGILNQKSRCNSPREVVVKEKSLIP